MAKHEHSQTTLKNMFLSVSLQSDNGRTYNRDQITFTYDVQWTESEIRWARHCSYVMLVY